VEILVQRLGLRDYSACFAAMKRFTGERDPATTDEIWLLEHPPVFTLGLSGRAEHIIDAGTIPVIHSDRGGQVTYHGPGQLVIYVLLDLKRRNLGVRTLVQRLEQAVIDMLAELDITGRRRAGAPGVYVADAKIASLGIRVRRGCSYHGLALNVNGDLSPFQRINPCGYPGLAMTSLEELGAALDSDRAGALLVPQLERCLTGAPPPGALRGDAGAYNRVRT